MLTIKQLVEELDEKQYDKYRMYTYVKDGYGDSTPVIKIELHLEAGQLHLRTCRSGCDAGGVPVVMPKITIKQLIAELKEELYDKKNIQIVSSDLDGDLHPIEKVELCLEDNRLHFCEYVIEADTGDPTTYKPDEADDTFTAEEQK